MVRASRVRLSVGPLLHQSQTFQPTSFTVSYTRRHLTVPRYRLSTFGRRGFSVAGPTDGLELATGQPPRPGAQQQQLQTIAEDESISLIPLSTYSAVEMLHDSALYESIVDIDIHIITWRLREVVYTHAFVIVAKEYNLVLANGNDGWEGNGGMAEMAAISARVVLA